MNAAQLITKLTNAETNHALAADTRRMMQQERFALTAAVQSGVGDKIKAATEEAQRVAKMWGVTL